MATLNSIDGQITSGGNNPPLNTEFPVTLYQLQFPANAVPNTLISSAFTSSITYINERDQIRTWNAPLPGTITSKGQCYPFILTDRIKKVISINNTKLTDLGLVFSISASTPSPTFINVLDIYNKDLNLKTYRVYLGDPFNVIAGISYVDENGVVKNLELKGATQVIKTTKITNYYGKVRIEDLNPEVPAIKKIIPPPIGYQQTLSLATGTYGTISSPVANLSFLNAPIVPLISGGDVPVLNQTFAATSYTLEFPEIGTGTIEYIDSNGKLKSYTLNKMQIMMPDGLLRDGIIQVNKLENVKLKDLGLMYGIVEPVPSPNFIKPTSMPLLPSKPKFYQVYFGNPVYPQGSVIYFDANGANKMLTNFGKVVTISAYSIYRFSNVKIVEIADYIDNNGNGVPSTWVNPQNPEGKYPKGY